jgi:signal peptidase I
LFELVGIIATALGLAVAIQAFLVKPYKIPSGSMLPTLHINQRVLVDRIGSHFSSPHIGDIIVFHPPAGADSQPAVCGAANEGESVTGFVFPRACDVPTAKESSETFIKRVVGLPGDRLMIRNGRVLRNGVAEKDSYIVACDGADACNFPQTIVVPARDYYVMGDNRPDSDDSRFWGPVPKSWIIGQAFFTYWPPGRLGFL